MITSADGFHFVYQPLTGDGTIVARVVSVEGSSAALVGVMIRETLSAVANHVYLFDYSSSLLMTERASTGAGSSYVRLHEWSELDAVGHESDGYHGAKRVRGARGVQSHRSFFDHRFVRQRLPTTSQ